MSHPLIKGSGDPLASPRCQVSKKKRTGTDEDSTSMEVQVPSNKDRDLAHGLDDVGNVPDNIAVEDSGKHQWTLASNQQCFCSSNRYSRESLRCSCE